MDQIEVTSDVEAITVSGGDNLNTIGATVQTIEISCDSVSLTASATSIDQVISATVETADVSGVSIDVITAAEQGPAGPTGPAGGGGSSYTHTQSSPSQSWVVFHQLNSRPIVSIAIDGEQQEGRITYPNLDSCLIEFNSLVSGFATCVG